MRCRSKSLGNFFTIREVLKKYHGMAMRWFLVGTQYRQPMNYSQVALEEASARLYSLTETLLASKNMIGASGTPPLNG
jgi:cysteinyl-tRNA synthetase